MKLKLIKKITEARDTKSFFFAPSEKITWQAGQYAYLTLGAITKQFTISSSSTEEFIQITTRIRKESAFKQNLDSLEIGSLVESRLPFGSFVLPVHSSPFTVHCFLAGGIGITPFRSMIKYNIDKNLKIPMHLIYSNSDSEFVFKKELDNWQQENEFLKVEYIDTSVFGRIDKLKIKSFIDSEADRVNWKSVTGSAVEIDSEAGYVNCMFWSVGPNMFVNAMEDILEELKIPSDQIHTEKFTGY